MSSKITLTALATLLTALSVHATASAQSYFPAFAYPTASEHQSKQSVNRLKARIPSNAFGSAAGNAASPRGRPFETDPDANVRFEMNRDDRDRRGN